MINPFMPGRGRHRWRNDPRRGKRLSDQAAACYRSIEKNCEHRIDLGADHPDGDVPCGGSKAIMASDAKRGSWECPACRGRNPVSARDARELLA